ncbi:MAG: SpoIIE family protein phosphatase [candidate division Zixibacteria bacterium]|nr:SpoIIE family protein phosphatase [candidate division Zixibacteria bacterium]
MTENNRHTKIEKLLLEAARVINSTFDYEELNERILRLVIGAVDAEAALVFRIDHNREDVKIRFMCCNNDCKMKVFFRDLGQGVAGWAAKFKQPVILNDISSDPRVDREMEKFTNLQIRSLLTVPLIGKGQMIGVVEAINKREGEFTEIDLDILTGLNNQMAVAIDNARLYRDVKREALEKDLLYEIGKKLSSSLTLDELLSEIMTTLKKVVEYDVGGIFLVEPEASEIKSIYTVGYDPQFDDKVQLKIGQGLVGYVANTNEPVIVSDVAVDSRYVNANPDTKSEIVVPIMIDDRLVGVINLESEKLNAYDQYSISLISAFASQAAVSLERTFLHESLLAGKKLEEQLNVARIIQRSFLPKTDPVLPGYDICGTNVSSLQVGGDYYDFITIVDDQTGIVIGDVSGKGIPAALIMASFRASLIAEIRNNYSIRTICEKVNTLLCESLEAGNFVTAVYGVLDSRNHILTFANCGHDLPILLKKNGEIDYFREGGPVLGLSPDSKYDSRAIMLNPGEIIVLYTDGVTEVFDEKGEQFGLNRLVELIKKHKNETAQQIQEIIFSEVKNFAARDHIFDDLTMIILKRLS